LPPELPTLAGVRHDYVQVNGFRMHVAEAGDPEAEPVVMVHGWPQHWWCWHKVIPRLAESYRVICPDLRGHDWGGMTGFLACIRHPQRFSHYLALGIAPPFPSGEAKDALQVLRLWYQIPLTAPFIAPRLLANPGFLSFVIKRGTFKKGAMTDRDIDAYARALAERPQVSLAVYRTFITRELLEFARGHWAGHLSVPTRLLAGEHDLVADADRINEVSEPYADDLQAIELPGVGHFTPEEAPDEVVERALSFFA
jgi:pimeloyl-ACP methyl ester carboxylesterase